MGYTYKITKSLAANCPRVANIILNLSLCITVYLVGRYKDELLCIRSLLIKTLKIQEKCIQIDSCVPPKSLISQLL